MFLFLLLYFCQNNVFQILNKNDKNFNPIDFLVVNYVRKRNQPLRIEIKIGFQFLKMNLTFLQEKCADQNQK
jgi:hypothetical protein